MKKLALLFILFSSTLSVYSQCDVNNKYDKIISGYHSSIALKDNGTYAIWGSSMSEMGTDVLSPQDINATNYSDLNGRTVYKAALGGNRSGASVDQAIFLTDYVGLWFWGVSGAVVKSTYLSPINIPGANAYGLPQGVVPESVKSLFATYQTLVISTDSGFVYMLTQTSLALEGNGGNASTAGTSTWQKVKINASTYLTNVTAVRGQVSSSSYNAFMAVTSSGAVYTWGNSTYLGDNSSSAARSYATQMTLPAEFTSSIPAMIGVTGGIGSGASTKNTYYLLSNAGNLYTLGDNSLRQCGDFTTTERKTWVRVQKSATPGDYLNNVNTISVQEHNSSFPAAAVVTSTGVLYTWGVNSSGMIGRTDDGTLSGTMNTVSFDPGIPVGFSVANDQALIVEVGGHTLVYTKVGSSQFCYVGHQISGSMGDGTTTGAGTTSTNTMIYNCSSTPAIAICGHVPVAASTTTSTISATPNSIVASGTSTSTVTVTLYNSSGTQLTTSGGIVVVNTTAGTISSITDNGDGTYSAILTSAVASGSATLSFSINGVLATATTSVTFTGGTTYTIISSAGANGSISPLGSTSVNSGATQLYTFTPSVSYIVDSLFIDGVAQAAANTYSFTNVTTNHTIDVSFKVSTGGTTYTIISSAGANGSISPAGSTSVNSGANQSYTFTPSAGYTVDSLFIDGVAQAAANTYSFTNVTTNHTIDVSFKILSSSTSIPAIAYSGAAAADTVNVCTGNVANLCPLFWGWSNYQWYLDGVAIAAPTGTASCLDASAIGSYTLAAQDGAGVWSSPSDPVYVNVLALPNAPTITAATDTVFCNGGNVILSSSSATDNQWFKDGSLLSGKTSQDDTVSVSGVYTAKVLTSNGCLSAASNAITVTVNVAATPVVTAGSATSFAQGDSVILSSTTGVTYQWYKNGVLIIGETNQTYTATQSGTYTVVITDNNGCTSSPSSGVSVTVILPVTTPQIAYNGAAATDTIAFCSGTICPLNWGYSNYQWYLNGVALAAPYGTASCLDSVVTGSYTLTAQDGFGTWSVQSNPVYIIVDTTCTVSSGTGGGVESKSLGDIIAKRVFGNHYNSIAETTGFNSGVKFNTSGAVVNGINDLKLSNLAPTKVINTDAAYVSTPTDLVNFTNATEVLAVDYAKSSNTKAVLFSTKTFNNIYSHTKPICDRLRGAELLEVKNVFVKGYSLVAYKIRQKTGELEYAINLSAGTSVSRNTISLQSHWFTDNYQTDEVLYNFQLWAVSYEMVQSMASDIIGKLQSNGVVVAVGNTAITKTFISKGGRKSTNIQFTLHNNSTDTIGYFELREKASEPFNNNQIIVKQIPFLAKANNISSFSIPVSDKYEHNIYVYLNNKLVDLVFFADGTWTLDYNNANTNINSFNVVNESNATVKNDEYRLFRNVTVSGTTKDYITVYKTMMGGGIEQNVSDYKSLLFNASAIGAGTVKITLVKKSIVNWNDQYSYTTTLSSNNEYGINISDFKSTKYTSSLNADDIVSVSFSFINSRGVMTNMNIALSNVRFGNSEFIAPALNVMSIKPNPTTGTFIISFVSDIAQPLVLKVIELSTGRVVKTNFINAMKGTNEAKLMLESNKLNSGTFIVTLEGDNINFNPAKLLFLNK